MKPPEIAAFMKGEVCSSTYSSFHDVNEKI